MPHERSTDLDGVRICLIVDHAIRDLPGIAHVATRLAARGATCFLTPHNLADIEIWRLAPDFVLLNYFRRNQEYLYHQLHETGIAYGVLDTEGGVMESVESYGEEMALSQSLRESIAVHCCWGPRLAEYLVGAGKLSSGQVAVTGCPRTDFYRGPLTRVASQLAPQADNYRRNLILLNSNFSLGNPGFLRPSEQAELMVSQLGHDPQTVERWQAQEQQGLAALTQLANRLATDLPQATIVYRPHPFENMATYDRLIEDRSNLHCLRSGPIVPWLVHAKAVIQRSCSTSIEAGLSDTPAFTPAWIPTSFERPAADATAEWVDDYGQLLARAHQCLEGTYDRPVAIESQLSDVIEQWFYQVDGDCGLRVADSIASAMQRAPSSRGSVERICRRRAYHLDRKPWSKKRIAGHMKVWMGLPPEFLFRRLAAFPHEPQRYDRWTNSAKSFTPSEARSTAEAIAGSLPDPIPINIATARSSGAFHVPIRNGVSISIHRAA